MPVKKENRIMYLDVLRGIAIFFILIINIYFFSGWIFFPESLQAAFPSYRIDRIIEYITDIAVEGKFYTIFSILFGIGFALQLHKAQQYPTRFVPFFRRRMAGLLLFGLLHLFLLWLGDILTLYALLGFLLIYFRNLSDKKLLRWAVILLFLPVLNMLFMALTGLFYPMYFLNAFEQYWASLELPVQDLQGTEQLFAYALHHVKTRDFGEFFKIVIGMPLVRLALILLEGREFKVLACFLIGLWAGRRILNGNLLENTRLLKKIMLWGFITGIPINLLIVYSEEQGHGMWTIVRYLATALGVVPLACAYAAAIALWIRSSPKFLTWFAPVGRMALSNYLSQTVMAIIIFYGIGFGYAATLGLWKVMLIAVLIFTGQMIFSFYWLKRFSYGPMEWLWRKMTYGKLRRNRNDMQPL